MLLHPAENFLAKRARLCLTDGNLIGVSQRSNLISMPEFCIQNFQTRIAPCSASSVWFAFKKGTIVFHNAAFVIRNTFSVALPIMEFAFYLYFPVDEPFLANTRGLPVLIHAFGLNIAVLKIDNAITMLSPVFIFIL